MIKRLFWQYCGVLFMIVACSAPSTPKKNTEEKVRFLAAEVNSNDIPIGDQTIAILGVSLIDGVSNTPTKNSCVIVRDGIITEIGEKSTLEIPEDAEIVDGKGLTLMPGLIDSHFHYDWRASKGQRVLGGFSEYDAIYQ